MESIQNLRIFLTRTGHHTSLENALMLHGWQSSLTLEDARPKTAVPSMKNAHDRDHADRQLRQFHLEPGALPGRAWRRGHGAPQRQGERWRDHERGARRDRAVARSVPAARCGDLP